MKKIILLLLVCLLISKPCFAAKMLGNTESSVPLISESNENGYKVKLDNKLTFIYYFEDAKSEKYENVQILPTGTINIPRVGETKVLSLTTKDIEELIKESIENISEAVVFINRPANNISVLGEVNAPGSYSLDNIRTIYDAIGKAKGFTNIAREKEVKLIRQKIDGTRISFLIDFPKEIYDAYEENSGIGPEAYILQEGDIIYVNVSKWKRFKVSALQLFNLATIGAVTGASAALVNDAID